MTFGTAELPTREAKGAGSRWSHGIEQAAYDILASHCPFQGRAREFEFERNGDVLTVRGTVPSFYLKQLLQGLLKNLDGVSRIDNRVDVVNPAGLSSENARSGAA
jgi:hypothetical protein